MAEAADKAGKGAARPSRKDAQAEAARRRICAAVVACIDEMGYAAASIARIQERAGVSRGALTHHFPTKNALMAETARRLLAAASSPMRRGAAPVAALVTESWERIANTPEGRALVEILIACRTDAALHGEIRGILHDWDAEVGASADAIYKGRGPDADDAALLWSITRSFVRGLIIHERYVSDPARLRRMVERFAGLIAAEMTPRAPSDGTDGDPAP